MPVTVGFGNFSNTILPAERRGRKKRRSFLLRVSEALSNSGSDLSSAGGSPRSRCSRPIGQETGVSRAVLILLLFDNCIGRKRDVGGVVLAGAFFLLGFEVWRELALRVWREMLREETTDGHVSRIHRVWWLARRNVVRRAGGFEIIRRMCLELVKNTAGPRGSAEVTSQRSDLIQLESLILAQNERWRQA